MHDSQVKGEVVASSTKLYALVLAAYGLSPRAGRTSDIWNWRRRPGSHAAIIYGYAFLTMPLEMVSAA